MSLTDAAESHSLHDFIDAALRGVGQVLFQNHPLSGALFLLAILANSLLDAEALSSRGVTPLLLFYGALLGTLVGTATARLLRVDRQAIADSLYGYNGTLVGIAVPFFFRADSSSAMLGLIMGIVASTAFSSGLMAAASHLLARWKLPALTAPFVLTTWLVMGAAFAFGGLEGSGYMPGAPAAPPPAMPLDPAAIGQGLLTGVGQVMLQGHAVAGALMLIGLLVNSRRAFVFALLGSGLGLLLGAMQGAPTATLSAGLHGFNPVLTGIALGAVFGARYATLTALLGMGATVVATELLTAGLASSGLPALTAPFILVTWLFLAARTLPSRFRTDRPSL